ncbi:MAG: glucan biosynthesis protein [Verrucomicrobiia bacterium]
MTLLLMVPDAGLASFGFDHVRAEARRRASRSFEPVAHEVPQALMDLSYPQYHSIEFKPQHALWAGQELPFKLQFFLPGSAHKQTVVLHEVRDGEPRRIPFAREAFSFGTNRLDLPKDLDYAGFRILHTRGDFGEVASFLGASYFRMIGRGQAFGASSRGLALNTASLGHEEFPVFREFWIQKPGTADVALTLWALLDSPSTSGAFEFTITPGQATAALIKAAFFARKQVKQFGIAPLTSMFLHDENGRIPHRDFRPEVHDSDGLLIHSGAGEYQWRPLESGKMLRVNAYQDVKPKGFGLMQRDRDFDHYQDLQARFELRPSVWVKPSGDWGRGSVQLLQLPTDIEYADNVVAFWVPESPPKAGQSLELSYQLLWLTNVVTPPSLGHVRAMRIGSVAQPPPAPPHLRFVIDFAGKALEALPATEQLSTEVTNGEGVTFVSDTIVKNEVNGTWRLVLEFTSPTKAVDLRALLKRRGQPATETWTFTWQP